MTNITRGDGTITKLGEDSFTNGLLLRVFNQESLFEPRMIALDSYEGSPQPEARKQIAQKEAEFCAAIHDKILERNPEYGALYEQYACAVRKLRPLKGGRTEAEEKGSTLTKVFSALKLLKVFPTAVAVGIAEVKMRSIFDDYCKSNRGIAEIKMRAILDNYCESNRPSRR